MTLFQPGYVPQQILNGTAFIGSTTASGVVIPASTTTSPVFGLWNPSGSNVNIVLVRLSLGCMTLGTPVQNAFTLVATYNTGANIATAAPVSAFTQTSSVPCLIGAGAGQAGQSSARFTLAATLTAAGTVVYPLPFTEYAGSATATVAGASVGWLEHEFDGAVGIAPGTFVHLAGIVSSSSTYLASIVWFELPIGNLPF